MSAADPTTRDAPAGAPPAIARRPVPQAMLASVLLHAAIAVAVWNFERVPAKPARATFAVTAIELHTWIELPRREEPAAPPDVPPNEPADAIVPQSATTLDEDSDARNADDSNEPAMRSQTSAETTPAADASSDAATEVAAVAPPLAPLVPEGYDFEAARADAVARVVEALLAESAYRTFSLDDLTGGDGGDSVSDSSDQPDLFAAAAEFRGNGVMTKRNARSRLMRNIIDLCNELTGGFSIQGLFNVCAEPGARADLFGHLRPQYMESVPLCTADEELDIEVVQSGAGAVGSFKCVLVSPEARRDLYSRYDPDLAGWVPSRGQDQPATAQ